jgi:hypothetical protein
METFKPGDSWDWSERAIDFALQLALLAALFAFAVWLWPNGVLDKPVSMIALGDWLWAAGAVSVAALGSMMLYFVLVEPILEGLREK